MVTGLDRRHIVPDRLHHTGTFVAEDDGEGALRVLAGERVRVCDGGPGSTNCSSNVSPVVPVRSTTYPYDIRR